MSWSRIYDKKYRKDWVKLAEKEKYKEIKEKVNEILKECENGIC